MAMRSKGDSSSFKCFNGENHLMVFLGDISDISIVNGVYKPTRSSSGNLTYPDAPCMGYLPIFTYIHRQNDPNVAKDSIHGAHGIYNI